MVRGMKRALAPVVALLAVTLIATAPVPAAQSIRPAHPSIAPQFVSQSDVQVRELPPHPSRGLRGPLPPAPKKKIVVIYHPPVVAGAPWRSTAVRLCIRHYESHDNYQDVDAAKLHFGAYQMLDQTFDHASGLSGHASDYSPAIQDAAFITITHRIKTATIMQEQFSTYRLCH